jgi:dTDP-4-dehydrorhamnose reductase
MRALVVGASGLVGGALLRKLGDPAVGTYHERHRPGLTHLDVRDGAELAGVLDRAAPDVIFYPAANANVDWCERNPAAAEETNLRPVAAIRRAAPRTPIVAYSSDYVFDGRTGPYRETDGIAPLSVYGKLKAQLESIVIDSGGTIVRSTGIFGWEPRPAKNFVLRLIASLRNGERARLPVDQIATPTYAEDLADASIELARGGERGVWHVAGPDLLSRPAFGRLVADVFGLDSGLIDEVPTSALSQVAPRPLRGGLLCARYLLRFGSAPVRDVRAALTDLRTMAEVTA